MRAWLGVCLVVFGLLMVCGNLAYAVYLITTDAPLHETLAFCAFAATTGTFVDNERKRWINKALKDL
jgi:hypothetical protein